MTVRPPVRRLGATRDPGESTWHECSACRIRYVDAREPGCPLCSARVVEGRLRADITAMRNALERAQESTTQLRAQVDSVTALRLAIQVIGDEDLGYLKSLAYRHQAQPGCLDIRIQHGPARGRGRARSAPPIGFLVIVQGVEDPETWQASSIGGVAIAGFYEEALQVHGARKAIVMLVRALAPVLKR